MIVLFCAVALCQWPEQVSLVKAFESPTNDHYLVWPVAMCFSDQGQLFVLDQGAFKVHIWREDGTYDKAFGRRGEGPGEFMSPFQIVATDSGIYVWEDNRRMSIFDLDGHFQRAFRTGDARPRVFGVLGPHRFLLGHKAQRDGGSDMAITLRDDHGKTLSELLRKQNDGFIKLGEGDNNAYLKAYLPDVDIQRTDDNTWYYGFSQDNVLYAVDADGRQRDRRSFELPVETPSDREIDIFSNLNFPGPDGQRIAIKDLPNIRVTYDYPKAHYTHFLIKGDRVAFVLTPIGSTDAMNTGFASASFAINDFKSGRLLSRGRYAFPEDSLVYYKNGRMLGCILNQDDEYEVMELSLNGL